MKQDIIEMIYIYVGGLSLMYAQIVLHNILLVKSIMVFGFLVLYYRMGAIDLIKELISTTQRGKIGTTKLN